MILVFLLHVGNRMFLLFYFQADRPRAPPLPAQGGQLPQQAKEARVPEGRMQVLPQRALQGKY